MDEIKIEKNVPVPDGKGKYHKWTDLVRQMDVGDSFLIPLDDTRDIREYQQNVLATLRAGRQPERVITRKVEGGLRVWRTE